MLLERKIRGFIRSVLLEEVEVTVRPGRGGYKKEIQATGALAKENPVELMNRLKISKASDDTDIKRLNSIMTQAVVGSDAMKGVYQNPQPRKDNTTGLEGLRIPVKIISPRDARKYLEHTVVGAQRAGYARFDKEIQVEILGSDVLLYFADRPYSWGRSSKKKKNPKPPAPSSTEKKEESDEGGRGLIGEPDFNPDRDDSKEEASYGGMSGAITPLGTGPTYPDKPHRKPQSPAAVAGRAFGNAKPAKKNNNKN